MNILLFNDNKVIYKYASAVSRKLNANLIECLNLIGIQIDDYDTALIDDDIYNEALVSELRENPNLRIGVLLSKDRDIPMDVDFHIIKPFLPATLLDALANREETGPLVDVDDDISNKELFENDSNNYPLKATNNNEEQELNKDIGFNENIEESVDFSLDDETIDTQEDKVDKTYDKELIANDGMDDISIDINDINEDDLNMSLEDEKNIEVKYGEDTQDSPEDLIEQDNLSTDSIEENNNEKEEDVFAKENTIENSNNENMQEGVQDDIQEAISNENMDSIEEGANENVEDISENLALEENLDMNLEDVNSQEELKEDILSDENIDIENNEYISQSDIENKDDTLGTNIEASKDIEEEVLSDEGIEENLDASLENVDSVAEENIDFALEEDSLQNEDDIIEEDIEPPKETEEEVLSDENIKEVSQDMEIEEDLDISLEDEDITLSEKNVTDETTDETINDNMDEEMDEGLLENIEEDLDNSLSNEDQIKEDTVEENEDISTKETENISSDEVDKIPHSNTSINDNRNLLKKEQVDEIKDLLDNSDVNIKGESKTQLNLGFEHIDYILSNYDINLSISFTRKR